MFVVFGICSGRVVSGIAANLNSSPFLIPPNLNSSIGFNLHKQWTARLHVDFMFAVLANVLFVYGTAKFLVDDLHAIANACQKIQQSLVFDPAITFFKLT